MSNKIVGVIPGKTDSYFVDLTYINFVKRAMQGRPRIICEPDDINGCQEILLIGGRDIDPTLFGEENYVSRKTHVSMDKFHIDCMNYAVDTGVNIFGICRGFQLIYYNFMQHLPHLQYEQHIDGHNQSSLELSREAYLHRVRDTRNGSERFVNSFHHQGVVIKEAENLFNPFHTFITNYALPKSKEKVGILEGVSFVVRDSLISGVQFHPEELDIEPEEYNTYLNQNPSRLG